jgi:hypothetical protein
MDANKGNENSREKAQEAQKIRPQTAQNRRGDSTWRNKIMGAPSFSPYHAPFTFHPLICVNLRSSAVRLFLLFSFVSIRVHSRLIFQGVVYREQYH